MSRFLFINIFFSFLLSHLSYASSSPLSGNSMVTDYFPQKVTDHLGVIGHFNY